VGPRVSPANPSSERNTATAVTRLLRADRVPRISSQRSDWPSNPTGGEIETAPFWFDFDRGRDAVAQTGAARAGRKVKITDALLREVADVYRANVSDKPTEAVAEHFDKCTARLRASNGHRSAASSARQSRGRRGAAVRGSTVKRGNGYSLVLELDKDPATGRRRQKWR
jgi:hypothetical protein